MFVRRLRLHDFRSWDDVDIDLGPGVTVVVGRNGYGKTNLVEALAYLATGSSHRVSTDLPLIRVGTEAANVLATVENDGRELTLEVDVLPGRANKARVNGAPRRSQRELLGILQTVLFAPEDLQLVRGEPAARRRFLDDLVITRTPRIAGEKSDYERVLRQRNALLKSAYAAQRRGGQDEATMLATLAAWDEQLARSGAHLLRARTQLTTLLAPHIAEAYHALAPQSRPAAVQYRSSVPTATATGDATDWTVAEWEAAMLAEIAAVRTKEVDRGQSLVGPHRDDLDIALGNEPAKGFASHGESWSLALSLRLGSLALLRSDGSEPVLILDDVFAELDAMRRSALATVAAGADQVIITAAVPEDLPVELAAARIGVTVEGPPENRLSRLMVGGESYQDDNHRENLGAAQDGGVHHD